MRQRIHFDAVNVEVACRVSKLVLLSIDAVFSDL